MWKHGRDRHRDKNWDMFALPQDSQKTYIKNDSQL